MLNCEICDKEAKGVGASMLGPISHAYCTECLVEEREVWSTLIAGLFELNNQTIADFMKPIIKATCKFYNKTEDEMWKEVEEAEQAYYDYMDRGCP
jgi:hypothetical protein